MVLFNIFEKKIDNIPKRVYNKNIERRTKEISVKHWKGEKMNKVDGILHIVKDLIEILVLSLTACQLIQQKKKKAKKSRKKKKK